MVARHAFVVTLRNERVKAIDSISLWISVISLVYILSQMLTRGWTPYLLTGFLLVTAGLGWNMYQGRVKHFLVFYQKVLLAAGFFWFIIPAGPLRFAGLVIVLLGLFEKQAKLPLEIGFSDDHIVINTLFRRTFKWKELSNVMLKNGMLTLDFKNNSIFQRETIDEGDDAEDEFNEYCRLRLVAARQPDNLTI